MVAMIIRDGCPQCGVLRSLTAGLSYKRTMKKVYLGLGAVFTVLLGYLLAWPVPIDPQAWTPPAAPALTGPYAVLWN